MNIQDLGSLGELVAAVATVATLGYLAYQIKINTVHSRAYTQRDLLTEIAKDNEKSARNPALTRKGLQSYKALSGDEKIEFGDLMLSMAVRFESSLRLHQHRLLDEVLFQGHRRWVLAWLNTPGGHEWWDTVRQYYSDDVRMFFDKELASEETLPAPITETMLGSDDFR
ncbi:MAG: hypothetical protein ACU84Q_13470 [Gammaproteobacteria bacterium]